jgi:cation/acetate symporter
MGIQGWTYLIVSATFGLYIGIAIWSRVRTTSGFYVAGRGVPAVANGMATGADWMSAASFISMAGLISFMGYDGAMYLMGWTGGYVLLALLLAPYLRRYGRFTVPEFVGDRYESQAARVVAVICAVFVSFTYVAGQMRGVGIVFSRFLEVDINLGVFIGGGIVLIYALLGGMRGITYTQVAQYCVLILAYLIPAVAISLKMTGQPIPQIGFGSELIEGENAGMYLLQAIDQIHRDLGLPEYTGAFVAGKKSMIDIFAITMALMVGTAGLPHVLIRFYTVPSPRLARWSALWALIFIALLYTTAPAVATFARVNLIQSLNGTPYDEVPEWFRNWETTGLIEFNDRDGDGLIRYSGDPAEHELEIDRDIIVLANPEIAQLPAWVVALVAAGGLAAALSTAAGLLLVISSSISHDLFKSILRPDMSEAQELVLARVAACGAIFVAIYFGVRPPDYVAATVAFAFGLAAASFFPVLVLGVFSKRVTKQGAIAGMLSGIVFTAVYISYFKLAKAGGPEDWWFGISPEGIGTVGMLINFAVTLGVSRLTPAPSNAVRELVDRIRSPEAESHDSCATAWLAGRPHALAICGMRVRRGCRAKQRREITGRSDGRRRKEDRTSRDSLWPLRAGGRGTGRAGHGRDRQLGHAGLLRAAAGSRGCQGGLIGPPDHQGHGRLRTQRPGQGSAVAGVRVLQAGRARWRRDRRRDVPEGSHRVPDPVERDRGRRVLARHHRRGRRSLDLRGSGRRCVGPIRDLGPPRRRDPDSQGSRREDLLRRLASRESADSRTRRQRGWSGHRR